MKIVLRKVRNNQYANKLVRIFLRKLHTFLNNAIDHWTPYGTVDVQFNGVCFSSYSEADDYITGNLYYNKPIIESRDLNVFLSFARHCETILDIGANVGLYSILSSKVNTKAAIYAFEPNKVNLARLKKNIELNFLKNIQVVEKAVGDKTGTIQFTVPAANVISDSSSALEDFSKQTYGGSIEWKNITVQQVTVDEFIESEGLNQVDLIKIDVEGYEMMVLNGAKECIRKYQPIIQCEIFVDKSRKQFFDEFLREYSYTAYMLISEGLVRLDKGVQHQSGHNFILMKYEFPDLITPVKKAVEYIKLHQLTNEQL